MSWDVMMIRTKTNAEETLNEIKDENIIPFKQLEIAHELQSVSARLENVCCCGGVSWPNLYSDNWSIEFCVGENEETEAVTLQIRGEEEPREVFAALAADLSARLIDGSTGEFICPDKASSFERWKAYRDQIVHGGGKKVQ